ALAAKDPVAYWTNPSKKVDLPIKSSTPIPGHSTAEEHCISVYDALVKNTTCPISIVAHSYGGVCTLALLTARPEIMSRLCGIAFTDAVHEVSKRTPREVREFLNRHAVNWVVSDARLDTHEPIRENTSGCRCVSAGTKSH